MPLRPLLWLCLALLAAPLRAEPACTGSVVAIGGALKDDNAEVWGRVVALAGGRGARFGIVTTSSAEPERSAREIGANLARHGGAVGEVLPLPAGGTAADDAALAERVQGLAGIWFSGGAQAKAIDALLPQGRVTPLLAAMKALHCRGGVIAGSSAGAALMSEVAFRDGPEPLHALKAPETLREDGETVGRGLGFAPRGLVLDQHFVKRGRIGRLLPLLLMRGIPLGLGVEEDSAAVMRGRTVEVIGTRGLVVVDTREARREGGASDAFGARGVRLSWLERGDRYDLATMQLTPSGRNPPLPLRPPGERRGKLFFADMLGDNVIVEAMTRLAQGRHAEARGLAFTLEPEPDDPAPRLAFGWRLAPDARTRAWRGSGDTVADMLLDVAPLLLAEPLATPWPAAR